MAGALSEADGLTAALWARIPWPRALRQLGPYIAHVCLNRPVDSIAHDQVMPRSDLENQYLAMAQPYMGSTDSRLPS